MSWWRRRVPARRHNPRRGFHSQVSGAARRGAISKSARRPVSGSTLAHRPERTSRGRRAGPICQIGGPSCKFQRLALAVMPPAGSGEFTSPCGGIKPPLRQTGLCNNLLFRVVAAPCSSLVTCHCSKQLHHRRWLWEQPSFAAILQEANDLAFSRAVYRVGLDPRVRGIAHTHWGFNSLSPCFWKQAAQNFLAWRLCRNVSAMYSRK